MLDNVQIGTPDLPVSVISSDKAAELVIAARSIRPEYLERAVQLDGIARVVVA